MDSIKLAEAFETLKGLVSGHRSGAHWGAKGTVRRPRAGMFGSVPAADYRLGASDWEILESAEALKLHALGLTWQQRLRRRDKFICSSQLADEQFSLQCLGGMKLEGNCLILNQTLVTPAASLWGTRTLLAGAGEHNGRAVTLHWKVQDGLDYQLCYTDPGRYEVTQHLQTCIWLSRAPEPYNGTGYLVSEFQ